MVREGLPEEGALNRNEQCRSVESSIPGRGNRHCEGSEVGGCLVCLRKSRGPLGPEWSG